MKPAPRLWIVAVKLTGPKGSRVVRAVMDTGANTSLMPPGVLRGIGCDPVLAREQVGILTASGSQYGAVVCIPHVMALNHHVRDLEVMSYDLPQSGRLQGILGMDFLLHLPAFRELDKRFQEFFV